VLQEAELSGQADSEFNLGGSSETMYYIGLDVHKKTISYCGKEERQDRCGQGAGTTAERLTCATEDPDQTSARSPERLQTSRFLLTTDLHGCRLSASYSEPKT
jgi:hypothetical protein